MSQRARLLLYLVAVHGLFAAVAVPLFRSQRIWLLAVELVLAVSLAAGLALVARLFASLALAREPARLLEDSDFMSRLRTVGQPEIDELIAVYNRMVDGLRAERTRLQEQHQFLAQVLRESPGGIVVLTLDGRLELVNPAAERLLQRTHAALGGLRLDEVDGALAVALAALPAGGAEVVPLWGGRRVRCLHGTFLDRGFRRSFFLIEELTDELRRSEKAAYEKVIRLLSHEVNNTVGAANSLLHSALTYGAQLAPPDREDFEAALQVVIARTAELGAFMSGFADVIRLPAPNPEPCDLVDLLAGVETLVSAECRERRIQWRSALDERLPAVPVDRVQMTHALVNIVKNAIEAIGQDGIITARGSLRGTTPVLEIVDSGPGIPPDVRAHLFTPFFSTKEGGQGIGLTLVREILDGHGFPCALDSQPGGPTSFTIVFERRQALPGGVAGG